MSLIASAIRIAAVRALCSGDVSIVPAGRFFDSSILPMEKLAAGESPEPFVTVSTEDENDRPKGRDFSTGDRNLLLVIETGIAKTVPLPGNDGTDVVIPDTDANLELALSVLDRQIKACLWGRGGGAWGDVFRKLASNVIELEQRRGVPVQGGQRYAARNSLFLIQPIAEPPFEGSIANIPPLKAFFAAAEADHAVNRQAAILLRAIEGKPIGWPDVWTPSAVAAGLAEDEGDRIGIVSYADHATEITVGDTVVTEEGE